MTDKPNPMLDMTSDEIREAGRRLLSSKSEPPRDPRNILTYRFPAAMAALLEGERVSRLAWANGFMAGDFLTITEVPSFQMLSRPTLHERYNADISPHTADIVPVHMGDHILRRNVKTGNWSAWTPNNEDIFAKDWIVL